jgi:hypothetical protein
MDHASLKPTPRWQTQAYRNLRAAQQKDRRHIAKIKLSEIVRIAEDMISYVQTNPTIMGEAEQVLRMNLSVIANLARPVARGPKPFMTHLTDLRLPPLPTEELDVSPELLEPLIPALPESPTVEDLIESMEPPITPSKAIN